VTNTVRIEAGRCGPERSGNGGWTAGLLAAHLGGAVTVTLRRPPPLGTDLEVVVKDGAARLLYGSHLVAEASVEVTDELDPVAPADIDAAVAAESAYHGLLAHPFPRCFVCGPERGVGDGLCLRPGPTTDGHTACTWVPHEAFADDDGRLNPAYVWAALDCPGGWTADLAGRPMVLGRMTAAVERRARVGERLVVVGQHLDSSGRKTRTATSLYDADGQVVGRAAQLWLSVDPQTFGDRAFGDRR